MNRMNFSARLSMSSCICFGYFSEKDMDAKNMTEDLGDIYAKLQDTKLKLQPLMDTFCSASKIKNSADQAPVQEVKAVVTDNQKSKGKQTKKSRKKSKGRRN